MNWKRSLTSTEVRKIRDAQRARIRAQLIGEGIVATVADKWIADWESRGADVTTSAAWDRDYEWILREIAGRETRS